MATYLVHCNIKQYENQTSVEIQQHQQMLMNVLGAISSCGKTYSNTMLFIKSEKRASQIIEILKGFLNEKEDKALVVKINNDSAGMGFDENAIKELKEKFNIDISTF